MSWCRKWRMWLWHWICTYAERWTNCLRKSLTVFCWTAIWTDWETNVVHCVWVRTFFVTYGEKVTVVTDHIPLGSICSKSLSKASNRLQSMLLKVQEDNFEEVFKPGSEIPVADTLSRAPTGKPIYKEVVSVNNISLTLIKKTSLMKSAVLL